jgi:hypothetical protein
MFKRRTAIVLATVAIIAAEIAIMAGLVIGLRLLVGMHVDAGLIVNSLVALGAFSAALAAVWVTTSDRRRAARAQAQLVVLNITQMRAHPDMENSPLSPAFQIQVDNYGELSILNVTLESVWLQMPGSRWVNAAWPDRAATLPIVQPRREAPPRWHGRTEFAWTGIVFLDEAHSQVLEQVEGRWPEINLDRITATISFKDAHGRRWRRSSDALLERL